MDKREPIACLWVDNPPMPDAVRNILVEKLCELKPGQRNMEFVYFKNMPGRLVWKYLPAHLLNEILAFLYFTGRGHLFSFLKSKIDFLLKAGRVLEKRREIQARRTVSWQDIDRMLERRWIKARLPGK